MAVSLGRPAAFALALALLASALSCGATSPSGSMTDTDPGTLTPGNYVIFTFNTSTGGNITVTLVSMAQPLTVEIQLGSVVNGACGVQVGDSAFAVGEQWTNAVTTGGQYCIIVDDISTPNPPASDTFTLSVMHPS
jgi:hypothetical protein